MSVILLKGFPSLLQVLRPFDHSMDWIPEKGSPNIVPTDEDALRAWLHVIPVLPAYRKRLSRQLRVMYNPKTLEAPSGRVEIRVQGMLENANLHPIGELKKRKGCRGAEHIQWLRLGCNVASFRERFQQQIKVLRAIVDACREQLGYPPIARKLPDSIVCRRLLKVEGSRQLSIQTMGGLGYLTPCSHKDLGIGDLLDIKLWVDISLTRGPDTVPRISFNLAFDEIVVVQTAGEVKKCRGMQKLLDSDLERGYSSTETIGYETSRRVDRPLSTTTLLLKADGVIPSLKGSLG